MVEIIHNNHFLEEREKLKEAGIQEQLAELKEIIPEQHKKKRYITAFSGKIYICDRRHESMSSVDGVVVADFWVLRKTIYLIDRRLFDIVKEFADKWGYEKIKTEYQIT